MAIKSYTTSGSELLKQKVKDYKLLFKFRLSSLVVFSAGIAFLVAMEGGIDWQGLFWLSLGGFLVTGAANALNQVLERDFDKLMKRTEDRPLAAGRMENGEAVLAAGLMSVLGLMIFAVFFNPVTTILGTISLLSYAFVYTPLKRVSPVAVWVGAIPGALPMAIGWVAATGSFGAEAFYLFTLQFLWQFPHFWAIAWVAYDDYARGGYFLLPSTEADGRTKNSAAQTVIYAALLLPTSVLVSYLGIAGYWAMGIMLVAALVYVYYAWNLYKKCTDKAAKKLMFCSFLYLPVVLLALLADKI